MDTSSNSPTPSARILLHVLMQRLATVKNQVVSVAIHKDESTVSRIASGESGVKLEDLQAFLGSLGLKVVDSNMCCVDRAVWESYKTLAVAAMTDPRKLEWDQPE